jgi:multidrug resistance efflux pump
MVRKNIINLIGLFLLSGLITACGAAVNAEPSTTPQPAVSIKDNIVSASAEVVAGKNANLSFTLGGPRVEVNVKAGDSVKADQVLASFPENALPQAIVNAKADLILAQDALNKLFVVDTALAQAKITLRAAQDAYDDAVDHRKSLNERITYREVTTKIENTPFGKIEVPKVKIYKGYATEETKAKSDEDVALAKGLLEDAQRELDRLNNLQNTADVQAAQTRVQAIESVIEQSKLTAPFDGTVVDLFVNSGEMVSPGAPVLLLADLSTLEVKTTDLNEVDVARIQTGDPVKVSFDALPNTTVTGKVTEISLKNAVGSGVYYDVYIALDKIPEELRWGMSAFVEIEVKK